jgi:hypothetical protein
MPRTPNLRWWLWMGRTQPWEFVITFRLPWRRRMYEINTDQIVLGYPRVSLRLRWGVTCDRYEPKRLVRAELPQSFDSQASQ